MVEQSGRRFESYSEASTFLWSIADVLRGDCKQHDYGKVILPLAAQRRLVITGQLDIPDTHAEKQA
ncbi:MAG: type I restriction-modification system subunit M N-terminal domain-containing protein [Polyangiales bacterium]